MTCDYNRMATFSTDHSGRHTDWLAYASDLMEGCKAADCSFCTMGLYSKVGIQMDTEITNSRTGTIKWLMLVLHNKMMACVQLMLLSSTFTSCMSSAIQWQNHQLSAVAAAQSPAWSSRCRLLQGPISFNRIHSGLGWPGSNLEVLSSV